ncbi:methyltransferase domain-containing protein [Fredinandcohnia humi]
MGLIETRLIEMGCIWTRKAVSHWGGTEFPYYVGYSSSSKGDSVIEVVVTESNNLHVLRAIVKQLKPKYVAIAIASGEWIWLQGNDLTATEIPQFKTHQMTFQTEATINMVLLTLFSDLVKYRFTPQQLKGILDLSLLAHSYAFECHEKNNWAMANTKERFIELCNRAMLVDKEVCHKLDDEVVATIVHHLSALPAKSPTLAVSYLKLTAERINQDLQLTMFPGYALEDIINELSKSNILTGNVLDLSAGYGAFLAHASLQQQVTRLVAVEADYRLSQQLWLLRILTGIQGISINYQIEQELLLKDYYALVVTHYPPTDKQYNWARLLEIIAYILQPNGHFLIMCPFSEVDKLMSSLSNSSLKLIKAWKDNLTNTPTKWHAYLLRKGVEL